VKTHPRSVTGPGPTETTVVGRILVVNTGSSSVKLRVLDASDEVMMTTDLSLREGRVEPDAVMEAITSLHGIDAIGHRIVHGGTRYTGPVLIDAGVRSHLEALTDLAPLHQPKSLSALDTVTGVFPEVPAVACFDTAFHAGMPPAAATYALPRQWRSRWDLRRFGFHGLSHSYAARRAAELLDRSPGDLRIVSCHLGSGASLTAIHEGHSVDTTMGFTPLEGLVMATRSGSVDPGLLLWLEEHVDMPPSELAETLETRSGLLGLAGNRDMKAVLEAEASGDPDAQLAIAVYLHRLRSGIAGMTASMGGLDCLVFTGGVGEHSPAIRERTTTDLSYLGIRLDSRRNQDHDVDGDVAAPDSAVRVLVIRAREDLEIARSVRAVLSST
jgi:acetate kinase